jgi:hypothetical protein
LKNPKAQGSGECYKKGQFGAKIKPQDKSPEAKIFIVYRARLAKVTSDTKTTKR